MKDNDKDLLCPNPECLNIPELSYIYNPIKPLIKYKCILQNNDNNEIQTNSISDFLSKSLHNIKCSICKIDIKDNENYLYCKECKMILGYHFCLYKHNSVYPNHKAISINDNILLNNCLEHNNTFIFRCLNCQESLCGLCNLNYHNFERHELKQLFKIIDDQNEIDKKFAEFEKQKNYLNKIKEMINKITTSLEDDIHIKERMIESYKNNKFNYQAINNFKQLNIKSNEKYEKLLKNTIEQYDEIKNDQNKNNDVNSLTNQLLSIFYYILMINQNEDMNNSLVDALKHNLNNEKEKNEINKEVRSNKTIRGDNSFKNKKIINNNISEKEKSGLNNLNIIEEDDPHKEIKNIDLEGPINNMIVLRSGNIALSSVGNVHIISMNNLSLQDNNNYLLQKIVICKSKRMIKYIYEFPDETLLCSTNSKIFRIKLINNDTKFNILGLIQLKKSEIATKLISLDKSFLVILSEQKKLCNIKLFVKNGNSKIINFFNNNINDNNKIIQKEEDNASSSDNSSNTKNKYYFQKDNVEIDKEFIIYEKGKNINEDKKLFCSIFPINKSNNIDSNTNRKTYEFIATSNYVYDLGDNRIEFYEVKAIKNNIISVKRTKKIENISCSTEADSITQINDKYLCIGLQNFNLNGQISGFAIVDINNKIITQKIKENEIYSLNYIQEKNILMTSMEVRNINGNYNMIKMYDVINNDGNIQLNKISQFKSNHKDIIVSLIELKQENSAPIAKNAEIIMKQNKATVLCASASKDKTR